MNHLCRSSKTLSIIITCLIAIGYLVNYRSHVTEAKNNKQATHSRSDAAGSQTLGQVTPVSADQSSVEGIKAPEFSLQALNGEKIDLKSYIGKPLLLVTWATWCNECDTELEQLKTVQDQKLPFKILLINMTLEEASSKSVVEYVKAMNINLPVLLDQKGQFEKAYHVKIVPTTFLLDEYGNILHTFYGPVKLNDVLAWLPSK